MDRITLSYGSGGRLMHQLIDTLFIKELANPVLRQKKDSAVLKIGNKKIAFTTDSYVVNPIFFPGGDIGSLAVFGTVNDLSVCGAKPLFMSLGLIIEEGFDKAALTKIIKSIKTAAKRSGVNIATGDTKVVEKGSCDKIFINTSGIGEVYYDALSTNEIRPGDSVIINGPVGDHAISVLSKREGLDFKTTVKSDSAPLNKLTQAVLKASNKVRFMRDPTRGGLATTLNEMVSGAGFGISINEKDIPLREPTRQACELLGLDPFYLACEGKVIVVVAKSGAPAVIRAMKREKIGRAAKIIGTVSSDYKEKVYLNTRSGGKRLLDMLVGEQLPRIC